MLLHRDDQSVKKVTTKKVEWRDMSATKKEELRKKHRIRKEKNDASRIFNSVISERCAAKKRANYLLAKDGSNFRAKYVLELISSYEIELKNLDKAIEHGDLVTHWIKLANKMHFYQEKMREKILQKKALRKILAAERKENEDG